MCNSSDQSILQEVLQAFPDNSFIYYENVNVDINSKQFTGNTNTSFTFLITDRFGDPIDTHGVNVMMSLLLYEKNNTDEIHKKELEIKSVERLLAVDQQAQALSDAVDSSASSTEDIPSSLSSVLENISINSSRNIGSYYIPKVEEPTPEETTPDTKVDKKPTPDEKKGDKKPAPDDKKEEAKQEEVKQGDDKKDEKLAMEHGKIAKKDFVGTHKQKEHSRRDDAQFEERMAKGGMVYEVQDGTKTLADFTTKKDAQNFMYEYNLKHPKAKLVIANYKHNKTTKMAKSSGTKKANAQTNKLKEVIAHAKATRKDGEAWKVAVARAWKEMK
jgi:hypothetical protein